MYNKGIAFIHCKKRLIPHTPKAKLITELSHLLGRERVNERLRSLFARQVADTSVSGLEYLCGSSAAAGYTSADLWGLSYETKEAS